MKPLAVAVVVGVFVVTGLLVVLIYREARSDDTGPSQAMVVLGAAQFNGIPSAVFAARLDTAKALFDGGAAPFIVVAGGRMQGDQFTEAEAGRDYLIQAGVPASAIQMEYLGTDTRSSLEGVADLLLPQGLTKVLLVSDGFHLFRSQMLASEQGFDTSAHASDDSPIEPGSMTEFRYVLRETVGVMASLVGLD